MIILYRGSVKKVTGEKRLMEGLHSPQRYQNFRLHLCFIVLMPLQCSMEGTSPGEQYMLSISSQNPNEQKKKLELCYGLQRRRTMFLALYSEREEALPGWRSCGVGESRDSAHSYTQSCQMRTGSGTAKPGPGGESWGLGSSAVMGESERNPLRLSQVRFVYTRRRALDCPDMRPAYMVQQASSGVCTQELLEMALWNTAGKGGSGKAVFGQLLEAGMYGCPVC